jgi:hypothetical protein
MIDYPECNNSVFMNTYKTERVTETMEDFYYINENNDK